MPLSTFFETSAAMTNEPTKSYLKVPYDLRPAKQVERRMMFDALQIMSRSGFDIGDYQYTGFGSIFFADFMLFHRYLGLTRLLNVEHDTSISDRIKFNRPFELIELEFKSAAEVIPTLHPDIKHILWLDYDDYLRAWMLQDLTAALNHLSVGSILLMSVDVNPPVKNGSPSEWEAYYRQEAGEYIPFDWNISNFGQEQISLVNRTILRRVTDSALAYRDTVKLFPILSFLYADGHEMYTFGGVIGGAREQRLLRQCDFERAAYIRLSLAAEPYRIRVPNLTRKERLYLDAAMPGAEGWLPEAFELKPDEVEAYREIYRFYPSYFEAF
jgi:hypothetical protein